MNSKFFEPLATLSAGGYSIKEAAKLVNCKIQTAYNLSCTGEFKSRVSAIRSEAMNEAVGKITIAANEAVETLRELLNVDNPPSIRANAAKAILAIVGPLTELSELRERIAVIESQSVLRIAK